ncbi:hypothetical protein JTB14_006763 [Gonioctena quinquepunctata]|nr:hypothetical protein JTB14_006763 [Gonioctena quinquepunctata]
MRGDPGPAQISYCSRFFFPKLTSLIADTMLFPLATIIKSCPKRNYEPENPKNPKIKRISLEQAKIKKIISEGKQKLKEEEPCDYEGTSICHRIPYEVNDGPLIKHLCVGSKARTQAQVGFELYTKDEHNKYVKQMKAFESEYTAGKNSDTDSSQQTPLAPRVKMQMQEKSRTVYVDLVYYNPEREKEKIERGSRKDLVQKRKKTAKKI